MLLCVALLLVLSLADASAFPSVTAVVVDDGSGDTFVRFGVKGVRRIPNNATLTKLGFDFASAEKVSRSSLSSFNRGPDIESMVLRDTTTDEVHRVECLKLSTLQDNDDLVKNYRWIGDFFNPFATPMEGVYVVTSGLLDFHVGFTKLGADFKPLNHSFLGIGPGKNDITRNFHIVGADSRVLPLPGDSFLLVCTGWYHPIRMRAVVFSLGLDANGTKVLRTEREYRMNSFPKQEASDQKNWMPWVGANDTILFAQSLIPLTVVRMRETKAHVLTAKGDGLGEWSPEVVSETYTRVKWDYGSLRGGSTAKRIGHDRLLTFFHSRTILANGARTTYYMGAILFSATAPFRILAASRAPIYHRKFYEGPWDHIRFYDYVVYPMNFVFHANISAAFEITQPCSHACLRTHNITLIMGYQDGEGFVADFNLFELLESMAPAE